MTESIATAETWPRYGDPHRSLIEAHGGRCDFLAGGAGGSGKSRVELEGRIAFFPMAPDGCAPHTLYAPKAADALDARWVHFAEALQPDAFWRRLMLDRALRGADTEPGR
jgi:hypothetical protein